MKNSIILTLSILVVIGALVIIEDSTESPAEKGAETLNQAADSVGDAVENTGDRIQNGIN